MGKQPPTTVWGALLVAADLLQQAGLAKLATLKKDYKSGKLCVATALQDALWPPPDKIPFVDGGIPVRHPHDSRCTQYWDALSHLDRYCGGHGDWLLSSAYDLIEGANGTADGVADLMRSAAQWRPIQDKIERSSLGTADARAMRGRTPAATARAIVARAAAQDSA